MMIFETHTPESSIAPFIESVFHFKDLVPDHSIERVVPTGHLFILFELDGFVRNTFDNETLQPNGTFTEVWISGMHRNYISISAHQKSEMFVIQFRPFGAYPFFHFPLVDLNEKIIVPEGILGDGLTQLRKELLAAKTSQDKFELADGWLLERFDTNKEPPRELVSLIDELQEHPVSNLSQVMEKYPASQKHLIAQFKKYVGLTPKYFQRILRFNEILQRIQRQEKVSWADVAYSCGYSDQSHFIKEFKHFSGFNPSDFLEQDFDLEERNFFLSTESVNFLQSRKILCC